MGHRQQGSVFRQKKRLPDGSFRELPNYCIMFRDAAGKQKKITVGPNKKHAVAVLNEKLHELHRGVYREIKPITFREYATQWIQGRANLKPSTIAGYASALGVGPSPTELSEGQTRERKRPAPASQLVTVFGDRPLESIDVSDVNRYLAEWAGRLKPKSLRNALSLLHKIFDDAREEGYVAVNRLHRSKALQRPKALREEDEPEIDVLTPGELHQLFDALDGDSYPLFLTAVFTGLRLGELLGLQWGDLDVRARRVHVRRSVYRGEFYLPKTKRSKRAVDVGDQLLSVLDGIRLARFGAEPAPPEALIFPSATSGPLDPDNLRHRVWAPALAKAKLRHVRIHSLRHTYASMLIAQGENIKYISSQLGHASVQITIDRYGHLFPDEKRTAAARLEAQLASAAPIRSNAVVTNEALQSETETNEAEQRARVSSGDC
jgi:integrase